MGKKFKESKYQSNDTKEIKRLIFITLGVLIVAVGLYFLTDYIVNKKEIVKFNNEEILAGQIFNVSEEDYYVFIYDSKSDKASEYQSLINSYKKTEGAIKVYYVDSSLAFNKSIISKEDNVNPTSIDDLKVKESALIFFQNKTVANYYTEKYENVLK